MLHTSHHPCWDAKNRHGLPDELPLSMRKLRIVLMGSRLLLHRFRRQHQQLRQRRRSAIHPTAQPLPQRCRRPLLSLRLRSRAISQEKCLLLMQTSGIFEEEIRKVFSEKGYYPKDTPWSILEAEGLWMGGSSLSGDNIVAMALQDRPLPF